MARFLMLVAVALVLAAISFVLYRRTPRGWTRTFLGIAAISAIAFPAAAVLHNAFDAVFHVDEPVFFLIAVIGAPLGVAVGLIGAAFSAYSGRLARR
jgi:hypothetical protein